VGNKLPIYYLLLKVHVLDNDGIETTKRKRVAINFNYIASNLP